MPPSTVGSPSRRSSNRPGLRDMATSAGTLDPERIAMLRDLDDGDGELLAILAREYERDSNLQLTAMRRALADADTDSFLRSAHTLKGASANLGAERFAELCARLEQLARTGGLDGAVGQLEMAATELHDVHAALDELLIEA